MDVTKIETDNLNLNMEVFNLNYLISDIVEDYNNQLDNENIKLEYEFIFSKRIDDNNGHEIKERPIKKEDKYNIYTCRQN